MPYWLPVSEFVLATVSLSHALPRGKKGVGGLGIQQDLVLPETHWWSPQQAHYTRLHTLLLINNSPLINFGEMQDKTS